MKIGSLKVFTLLIFLIMVTVCICKADDPCSCCEDNEGDSSANKSKCKKERLVEMSKFVTEVQAASFKVSNFTKSLKGTDA